MTITVLRPVRASAGVADLYAAFVTRRASEPQHERLLDVVIGVLARADRVVGAGHGAHVIAWERLLGLLEELSDARRSTATCAVSANLVGLAVYDDPADHADLADLVQLLGHGPLARLQHRHGRRLEGDASLPVATAVIRRLLAEGLRERLAAAPATGARFDIIDNVGIRAAHALLQQGVDRSCPAPPVESVEELLDIAENGTIGEWRHLVGLASESAWSPYAVRVADLAREAGFEHAAAMIAALLDLCREQQREAERDTVAREIGRLVALSGVPEPEFAAWMGTTPERLSTYASGTVTPSAAVMLRISRTSLVLQRRAALDAAVGNRKLLSVPGDTRGARGTDRSRGIPYGTAPRRLGAPRGGNP
ncbi:hypothetical protein [Nocardioides panacisoli]|uniref:XRE family transcriptional regulator n=1 Tax=Nocardioides panacisoli TaxID=627624 RepID=A0ABP7HWJ5_9ACTN